MNRESVKEDNMEQLQLIVDVKQSQELLAAVVNKVRPDLQVHQDNLVRTVSLVHLD